MNVKNKITLCKIHTQNFKNAMRILSFRQLREKNNMNRKQCLVKVLWGCCTMSPRDFLPNWWLKLRNFFWWLTNQTNTSLPTFLESKRFCMLGTDFPFLNQLLDSVSASLMMNECVFRVHMINGLKSKTMLTFSKCAKKL